MQKGDWEYIAQTFQFEGSYIGAGGQAWPGQWHAAACAPCHPWHQCFLAKVAQICPFCRASKTISRLLFSDFSPQARHRRTCYTHQQWVGWQNPHLQSPLMTVPGWHLWRAAT